MTEWDSIDMPWNESMFDDFITTDLSGRQRLAPQEVIPLSPPLFSGQVAAAPQPAKTSLPAEAVETGAPAKFVYRAPPRRLRPVKRLIGAFDPPAGVKVAKTVKAAKTTGHKGYPTRDILSGFPMTTSQAKEHFADRSRWDNLAGLEDEDFIRTLEIEPIWDMDEKAKDDTPVYMKKRIAVSKRNISPTRDSVLGRDRRSEA